MAISTHYKQPAERYAISMDFTDKLPDGQTILSATCTALDEAGADASSTVLDGACGIAGSALTQIIKAGTAGQRYDLTFRATLTPGSYILEEDVALFVREE
jgi:hypothetical protein